ncbi:MAG: uroporphyrinogen-III C-methyltransferase [Pseudomonadota bacterium]
MNEKDQTSTNASAESSDADIDTEGATEASETPPAAADANASAGAAQESAASEKVTVLEAEHQKTEPPTKKPERFGTIIGIVAFLIACIAVVFAAYLYREIGALRDTSAQQASSQSEQIADIDVRIQVGALESQLAALAEQDTKGTEYNDSRFNELQEAIAVLQENGARGDRAWVLAEVRYLLRMAIHRITLAGDLDSAAAATRAADDQLHALADVGLLPVRQTLAEEIAELRAASRPDIEGKVLTLIHLARRTNALPLTEHRTQKADLQVEEQQVNSAEDVNDTNFGGQFMDFLSQFVVIREAPTVDTSTPEERAAAALGKRASLQVVIQSAQIAVLRRDQSDFELAINKALTQVREHFHGEDERTVKFAEDLNALLQTPVRPEISTIGSGLKLLNEIESKVEVSSNANAGEDAQ